MTHSELQELLGAYALDAVAPDEAVILEAHLAECPSCRGEVAAYRETAAKLGNAGGEAPPQLWDRIAGGLSSGPDRAPAPSMSGPIVRLSPPRLKTGPVAAAVFAAAAAVLIALLGISTLHLQHRVNALRDTVSKGGLQQAAAAAVLNPDHTTVHLASVDGRLNADIVASGDQAYLIDSNLPAVAADRTYQLWGVADGRTVSLGLLGARPQVAAFTIDSAVTRLMVTIEPEGGRPAPDGPVLIQGPV